MGPATFFSQPVYFTNSRGNEPLYYIDCSLVKREMKTPSSNRIFCSLSKLLKICDNWIPSDGLQAITFWFRFDQRDSRLSLKLGQFNRKWLTSSTLSLQRRQSSPSVLASQGTPPLIPKFPMSLICTWRCLTSRVLSTGGAGGSFPRNVSASPPPKKKVLRKK